MENGVNKVSVGIWKSRAAAYGADQIKERWDKDIVGAIGEYALAEHLGIPMSLQDRCDYEGDVGPYFVRATPWPRGAMPIHTPDIDNRPYVHAIVHYQDQCCYLYGWCYAREAKQVPKTDAKIRGRFAHWIEQDNPILKSMDDLPEL
jgi:hypothetical protein